MRRASFGRKKATEFAETRHRQQQRKTAEDASGEISRAAAAMSTSMARMASLERAIADLSAARMRSAGDMAKASTTLEGALSRVTALETALSRALTHIVENNEAMRHSLTAVGDRIQASDSYLSNALAKIENNSAKIDSIGSKIQESNTKNSASVAKTLRALLAKPDFVPQTDQQVVDKLDSICKRLDALEVQQPPIVTQDSPAWAEELISYLNADKQVKRDNEGNIVGWGVSKSRLN